MAQTASAVLLEREHELSEFARLAGDARAGRGRAVLVEGPPGIGKTRLLEAARAEAQQRGMLVLRARASELDRDFPFGLVRQLFEPVLSSAGPDRRAAILEGAAGLAESVLGTAAPESSAPGEDPSLSLFHALYWLTSNLADNAPVALVIDDLHWADASSLRFFEFLLPRLEELPVLLALATRPDEPGSHTEAIDALATDPLTSVLRLSPLGDDSVAVLITRELGESAHPLFRDACRTASGGNPFLLRELLRELAAEGVSPEAERVPLVRQVAPPTVARAVLLRLARLGPEARSQARAVAVLGDGAPLRHVCALAGIPAERADELAEALARVNVLAPARPLAFAHPVLRSAVYADMDAGERARVHRRAARLLAGQGAAPDAIALHLLPSEPAGDDQVVATLREAGSRARARGAAATAVSCLRRALSEPPPADERVEVLQELASAELHAGDPGAAADHFAEASRLTDDPRLRAAHAGERSVALQALGRNDEARALVETMVADLADVDPELALSIEASLIAGALLERPRRRWARERLERHRGRLTGASDGERKLMATLAHLDAFSGDASAQGLADVAERALRGGELLDESAGRSTPFVLALNVLLLADRVEPARGALEEGLEHARRRGSRWAFAAWSGWRCWLLTREGVLAEAEADARSCTEVSLAEGWFAVAPPMLGFALAALIERGELDDAERLLEQTAIPDRLLHGDASFDAVLHARARIRAARGDLGAARSDLARLGRRRARWNTFPAFVPPLLVAPELVAGAVDAERRRAERMLSEARTWGTPRAIGMALHALGLAATGERRLELLAEAVATLEASPARVEQARALCDLGAALRRVNRCAQARGPLRQALDIADACGARPLAENARHELRAAGGRPRRPRSSGAESLTASEQRVAAMAADGLSNPEIAQALFVTKKTVEAHLGSAYRKLGIASRTELAAALARGEKPDVPAQSLS